MNRQDNIEKIIITVADEFSVDPMDVVSVNGENTLNVIAARQVCALFLRDLMLSSDIGSLLGKRGHQYLSGAISAVTKKATKDPDFADRVLDLHDKIHAAGWLCSP